VKPFVALALSGTILALVPVVPPVSAEEPSRTLSVQALVEAHRAVARLDHRDLNWPEVNPVPKPPFEEYVSEETLARRATEPLRMSAALERLYGAPITEADLQAELERQSKATKLPDRLREIRAALGNDPMLVAEAMARPILAENRLRARFQADESIQGPLRKKVLEEIAGLTDPRGLAALSGQYVEVELRLRKEGEPESSVGERGQQLVFVPKTEWSATLGTVRCEMGLPPSQDLAGGTGVIGKLRESDDRLFLDVLTEIGPDHIVRGTVSWRKPSFGDWWSSIRSQFQAEVPAARAETSLVLPEIPPKLLAEPEIWEPMSTTGVPAGRVDFASVFSGTEMVVWGGCGSSFSGYCSYPLDSGGRYNPTTDSWVATSTTGAPTPRKAAQAVWTGTYLVVWGNGGDPSGGRYAPASDSWSATSTGTYCPAGRHDHSLVWSGTYAIVWGGELDPGGLTNTGGRYDPSADGWSIMTTAGAPMLREFHTATYSSADLMIVWGGMSGPVLNTGGEYSAGNFWAGATPTAGAPEARRTHSQVTRPSGGVLIWGGQDQGGFSLATGALLDGGYAGAWSSITETGAPSARQSHAAAWGHNAQEMSIWGGWNPLLIPKFTSTGAHYNPTFGVWTPMTTTGAPTQRAGARAVDIGSAGIRLLVWGGWTDSEPANPQAGGIYLRCSGSSPALPSDPLTVTDRHPCTVGIRVAWKDASDWRDEGYGTRSYEIYRNGTLLTTLPYGALSYTDTTVTAGTSYSYFVRYWNGCGHSADTPTLSATDTVAGSAPTSLTNNTVGPDPDPCNRNNIPVSWTREPVAWNDSADTETYRSYEVLVDGQLAASVQYSDGVTSTTVWVGTSNTSHTVSVRYRNGCDFAATTAGVPASDFEKTTPVLAGSSAADASGCAESGVLVSWPADATDWGDHGSGTRSYVVYRGSINLSSSLAYGTTSFTDTSGETGVGYSYSVRYTNGCSLSNDTTPVVAADNLPSVPASLTNNTAADVSACADSGVTVTWSADVGSWGDGGTGTRTYTILRNGSAIASGGCLGPIAYGTTTCTDTTGTNGTAYTYAVTYGNGCGLTATTTGVSATDVAPAAPTVSANNTAADASACDDTGVTVSWSADPAAWGDNGNGTRSYTILRGGTALGSGGCSGSLAYGTTTCTDTTGTNGTAYTYSVRYDNGCALSKATAGVSATDLVGDDGPTVSANNTAADVSPCNDTGVTVTWPADPASWGDNGSGTRTYTILRGGTPLGSGGCSGSLAYGTTTCTDTTGTNGTAYTYSVRYDNGCVRSKGTLGVSATDAVGAAPTVSANNAAADASACDDTGVTVTWPADPAVWGDNGGGTRSYTILRGGTPLGSGGCSGSQAYGTTTCTDTTGTNGTAYTYSVRYNNGCALTKATAGVSATDLVGDDGPTVSANNTAADASPCNDTGVTVSWTADPASWGDNGSGPRTYTILRGGTPLGSGGCSGSLAYGTTTCTDPTGTNGTAYNYSVRYNNGCARSKGTLGVSATDVVDTTACSAVGNTLSLADDGTDIDIAWTAVACADLANYRLFGATTFNAPFPSSWTLLGSPTGTSTTDPPTSSYVVFRVVSVDACGNASAN
jgi:hypothetical protein